MTKHRIRLNGKELHTVGSDEQYNVVTMIKSFDRLDADGLPVTDSSATSEAFDATGRTKIQGSESIQLKTGDVIQVEIL